MMSIYNNTVLAEQPIYGSSRIGLYKGGTASGTKEYGKRQYELTNHLGNVLATVSDKLTHNGTGYVA